MKRRHLAMISVGVVAVAAALIWWFRSPVPQPIVLDETLPQTCHETDFEAVAYIVCEVDPHIYHVMLFRADAEGKPFGSVENFDKAMIALGKPVLLAMNAGMYHQDLTPVGLFIENGREEAPLNTANGAGNFFMKPNGIFLIGKEGQATVMETSAYASRKPNVAFATQSGPMLVIDGRIHPRFEQNGASRYVRNGVGVRDDGMVVLAISRSPVSFGSFARLFRDPLACPNALFFDGAVSTLSDGRRTIVGGKFPAGPILAVTAKR